MHFVNTVQFKKAVEISLSFKMCFRKLTWSFSGGRVDLDLGVGGWWGIVSHSVCFDSSNRGKKNPTID